MKVIDLLVPKSKMFDFEDRFKSLGYSEMDRIDCGDVVIQTIKGYSEVWSELRNTLEGIEVLAMTSA